MPGEHFFISIGAADPNSHLPLLANVSNNTDHNYYYVSYDIRDPYGKLVSSKSLYIDGTTAANSSILPSTGLYSGTYTIRVFGNNVAPSYK